MKFLLFVLICGVVAVAFWKLGEFIGTYVAKRQKFNDEVRRNGSKRR